MNKDEILKRLIGWSTGLHPHDQISNRQWEELRQITRDAMESLTSPNQKKEDKQPEPQRHFSPRYENAVDDDDIVKSGPYRGLSKKKIFNYLKVGLGLTIDEYFFVGDAIKYRLNGQHLRDSQFNHPETAIGIVKALANK